MGVSEKRHNFNFGVEYPFKAIGIHIVFSYTGQFWDFALFGFLIFIFLFVVSD